MKTKLPTLLIGLALLASMHSTLAQVTNLGIAPAPGGQSLLYWPVSGTNYRLQTTANLAAPNWVTASNAVTDNAVVVTSSAPAVYFRLLAQMNTTAGMVLIPAGSFRMGNYLFFNSATNDPDIDDANPTNIYVSAFYMDVNLVSSNQWWTVYSYATNHGYGFVHEGLAKAATHPVQTVDWFDCVKWSNARSVQAGLIPCYYTDVGWTQIYTNGEVTVYVNWAANGYRLPTEAEWEKAARGRLSGQRFPWGNSISGSQANYTGYTSSSYSYYLGYDLGPDGFNPIGNYPTDSVGTSPVGSFAANGYGLNDMAGNVMEWCWDWYTAPYGKPTTNNPTGPAGPPAGPLSNRVLRGGYWANYANVARCAWRGGSVPSNADYPGYAVNFIGIRCVRGL